MTIFKKIFKLTFRTPMTMISILLSILFMVLMTFSNTSFQESKTAISLKSNVDVSELETYLAKSFVIKKVANVDYALNTMYIDGYVEVKDNYDHVIVHTKTRAKVSTIQMKVDQFLNAKAKNDLSLLERKIDLEIIKTPASKTPMYLSLLGLFSFIISGNLVISVLEKVIKKDVLNRLMISPIQMKNLITQIVLGIMSILLIYLCLLHSIAMLRLQFSLTQMLYYFTISLMLFLIAIALATMVYILTQDVNAVVVACSGVGTLLYMMSGGIVPHQYLPTLIQAIAKVSPIYYYHQLNLSFNLSDFGILFSMVIVVYLILGIVVKTKKIEE